MKDKKHIIFSKEDVDRMCDEVNDCDMIEEEQENNAKSSNVVNIKNDPIHSPVPRASCSVQINSKHSPWDESLNWNQVVIIN